MSMTPSASTVAANARLTPHRRHRELAAGKEASRLARQSDQRRLGERRDRALALERVELEPEVRAKAGERLRQNPESLGDRGVDRDPGSGSGRGDRRAG